MLFQTTAEGENAVPTTTFMAMKLYETGQRETWKNLETAWNNATLKRLEIPWNRAVKHFEAV